MYHYCVTTVSQCPSGSYQLTMTPSYHHTLTHARAAFERAWCSDGSVYLYQGNYPSQAAPCGREFLLDVAEFNS